MHRYRSKIKKLLFIYNALPNKIKKEIKLNELEIDKLQKCWAIGTILILQLISFLKNNFP